LIATRMAKKTTTKMIVKMVTIMVPTASG
jgi:hypothetical protein